MKKIIVFQFIVLTSCLVLNTAYAQKVVPYGRTELYSVVLNKFGACVASREIAVKDRNTRYNKMGAFSFGIMDLRGQVIALVSFMNPNWQMRIGQYAKGRIEIDNREYPAIFWADKIDILSGAIRVTALKDIAFGNRLKIDTGHDVYTVPLTGTAKVLPFILRCYKENFASKTNPLGDYHSSGQFQTPKKNPLGPGD